MLATKEICKVRRDAVGGKTKAYAYAIVERNNKRGVRGKGGRAAGRGGRGAV